jgi:hypothetical protein
MQWMTGEKKKGGNGLQYEPEADNCLVIRSFTDDLA